MDLDDLDDLDDLAGAESLTLDDATPVAVAAGYTTRRFIDNRMTNRKARPAELDPSDIARRAWAAGIARAALDAGLDRAAVVHLLGVAPDVLDELLDYGGLR